MSERSTSELRPAPALVQMRLVADIIKLTSMSGHFGMAFPLSPWEQFCCFFSSFFFERERVSVYVCVSVRARAREREREREYMCVCMCVCARERERERERETMRDYDF